MICSQCHASSPDVLSMDSVFQFCFLQVLVASDAIGMGITLNLRRIIFHSLRTFKPSTKALQPLDPSHIKQIAGACPSPVNRISL